MLQAGTFISRVMGYKMHSGNEGFLRVFGQAGVPAIETSRRMAVEAINKLVVEAVRAGEIKGGRERTNNANGYEYDVQLANGKTLMFQWAKKQPNGLTLTQLNAGIKEAVEEELEHRQATPPKTNDFAPRLSAVGRILNRQKTLVGLVLSDGKQSAQKPLDWCITHAGKGEISNIKVVHRAGFKPYLQGKGISLGSLPVIPLQ